MKTIFEENSNIYIFSRHTFLNRKNRIGQCPYMYCIDKHESIDIDSEIDFLLAENMIQNIDANKKI